MSLTNGSRTSFFPKVDAAVLRHKHKPPSPSTRPKEIGPILDPENADKPIKAWSPTLRTAEFPPGLDDLAPVPIPEQPACYSDRYLQPRLTKNERLRLTMFWYYTRDILQDNELLSRLQDKCHLVEESIGWEFVIIGLLDLNTYTRVATLNLPLVILPRRESTCAHTVNQPLGSVFLLPHMIDDWRFRASPHVDVGGIRSYAGSPLRLETDSGDCVALGSLCVASNANADPLTRQQQVALARLSDWVVADIVQSARARRQRERRRMTELIARAQREADEMSSDEPIIRILEQVYPEAIVQAQHTKTDDIIIEGRPIHFSAFEAGLWEDIDYLDDVIENHNHKVLPKTKVIRVIAAPCENEATSAFLVVASKDFALVFDDVDSWFVHTCAGIISQVWHKHLLREAIMAKEKFLRGITHQLRTPIHGILGSVELLAEEFKSRGRLEDAEQMVEAVAACSDPFIYINTIKTAGKDLISIVNSMITLNQWADVATTKRDDALHTIRELGMEFSSAISQAISGDTSLKPSVFLNHRFPLDVDAIWIDLTLLKHSLIPLFVNAIQNTADGIVMITATLRQDCHELVIDVEDTGCGIKEADQRRIFDAYEKVDIHSIGAGLGLTLSAKFASLLGGTIELVSSSMSSDHGSHLRATFGKVQCQRSSTLRPPLTAKLGAIPCKYHILNNSPNRTSLSSCVAKFLDGHGFTASDSIADSFALLDYDPDAERRREQFSRVPPEQIAICLIPASQDAADCIEVPQNIIFVRPPFLGSTLRAALEQADAFLREMQAPKVPVTAEEPEVALREPTTEVDKGESPQQTGLGISCPSTELETAVQVDSDPALTIPAASSPARTPTSLIKVVTPLIVPIFPSVPKSARPAALLVDDNALNLRIMQMYCNKRNLSYHCATDGRQAIDMYAAHQSRAVAGGEPGIELVLMDLQMPVCDGIEATREIRGLEGKNGWPRSVLFIVTGQDSPVDRTSAAEAGADEYYVKPVGIKILDRAVAQYFPAFQHS